MKRLFAIILICASISSCASLRKSTAEVKYLQTPDGQLLTVRPSETYPKVVVTPDGRHAQMMKPTGNLAVVVNPDGTHSTALINGLTATVITR